jgi:hypothetical protein
MDGKAVYRFVEEEWKRVLGGLAENRKLNPDGITYEALRAISPHLANFRMFRDLDRKSFPDFLKKSYLNGNGDNEDFFNNSTASGGKRDRKFIEEAEPGSYLLKFTFGAELGSCGSMYQKPFD